jgi:ketosteroid isomerase-like protein
LNCDAFLLKTIDQHGILGIVSVSSMLTAALPTSKPIRYQRLYALTVLLALSAYAPALFAAPQRGGMPGGEKGGLPRGEKHESRREIDQLEEKWRNAVLTGDVAAMDSLLADDYIAISARGTLQTKEETLTRMRSGLRHITALELSDSKVRFYGATALVTSFAHVTGVNADGEAIGDYRYTRVYVRNAQGKWKIVSFEASRIRTPGARR